MRPGACGMSHEVCHYRNGRECGAGPYHVQVGAFTSPAEAETRLGTVKGRAANLLDGHDPLTTTFKKNTEQWYRARFAGFSQDKAKSTCAQLKKMSLDCIVMRAE